MLADVGGGDVFSCVRLLLPRYTSSQGDKLKKMLQPVKGTWRSRAQRRRAQRKRAMSALIGARRGVDIHAGGEGGEHDKAKSSPL
eukprot:2771906-Prymnesium_polylepis.1